MVKTGLGNMLKAGEHRFAPELLPSYFRQIKSIITLFSVLNPFVLISIMAVSEQASLVVTVCKEL